ncbi:MAG: hypothetical protein JW702_07070, partial [Clostridiales bacterium]|nr:hypothetical protein [Clostridiales bacterium]
MEENDIQGKSKKIKKDKKVKKQKKKKGIFGKFIGLLFLLAIIAGVIYFFNLGKYFSIFDKVDNPAGEYLIPLWLEPDMTTWQIDNKIEEPISVMSSDTDVILGDYEKYGIEILIPGGAFNQPTELVLKKPEGDMLYDKNAMSPLGTA